MPNWVYNEVDIHASMDEVQAFLATDNDMNDPSQTVTRFNLHKLYPARFGADDLCGFQDWDHDWMVENTGSKWNPTIDTISEQDGLTRLGFDSAWSPMNELLSRLHVLTAWTIHNEFEEEQPEYEGSFHCEGGACTRDLRPGQARCSSCEERWPYDDLDSDWGECPKCAQGRGQYLVALEPDGAALINCGEHKSADLHGDVVLGVFTARSPQEAYLLARCEIPQAAKEGFDLGADPEGFGLKAYLLADSEEGD